MKELYHPALVVHRKYLKQIYSLYLRGKATEDIQLFCFVNYNLELSEDSINHIITEMNDAFL